MDGCVAVAEAEAVAEAVAEAGCGCGWTPIGQKKVGKRQTIVQTGTSGEHFEHLLLQN